MTIFAGCTSLGAEPVPEAVRLAIRQNMSRRDGYSSREISSPAFFAATIDIGAYSARGEISDALGSTVIVGDPVLRLGNARRFADRRQDAALIHAQLAQDRLDVLACASGTFAGFQYLGEHQQLRLFTDQLGVRPVFVACRENLVFFSSALRILESVPMLPKRVDMEGALEEISFRYSLSRKSPYEGIERLNPGEILTISPRQREGARYSEWESEEQSGASLGEHAKACHDEFIAAIQARRQAGRSVVATLSGGVDSRCVVGALRQCGMDITTINFAPPNTQDQVFARRVANQLGTSHREVPLGEIDFFNTREAVRRQAQHLHPDGADTGHIIWTGNGGSVGVGLIYMTSEIVGAMRDNRPRDAIRAYLRNNGRRLVGRPFRPTVIEQFDEQLEINILEELMECTPTSKGRDPAVGFYRFLMRNDQKRSLHPYFEDQDLHGIEYLTPFFDTKFLAAIQRIPIDHLLYHHFYHLSMKAFPEAVWSNPWQTYPGHEACPIISDEGLGYQFGRKYSRDRANQLLIRHRKQAAEMLRSPRFANDFVDRRFIQIGYLLNLLGSDRSGWSIEKAYLFHKYWRQQDNASG